MTDYPLYLRPDGRVECLYFDAVKAFSLGVLDVRRASSVEFNNTLQSWTVDIGGNIVATAPTREEALALEVEEMTRRLERERR